jgi:hypothetical protein
MDKRTYISMACGVIVVGILLIIMDLLATKLDGSFGHSKPLSSGAKPDLSNAGQDEYRKRWANEPGFYGAHGHRMRNGGLAVVLSGVVALVVLLLMPDFNAIPSEDVVLRVGDLVTKRTKTPCGQVNVIAAIGFAAISALLFWGGIENWRRRRSYVRAIFCFVLGLGILLEGVFHWQ